MVEMDHSPIHDSPRPTWMSMVESPPIEQIPSKYKLKIKYGGIFKLSKNSSGKRYCFGFQKCINMDTSSYNLDELYDDVKKNYPTTSNLVLSIHFVDKYATEKSFIELDSNETFMAMISMYEKEKQITIYASTNNDSDTTNIQQSGQDEAIGEPHGQDEDIGEPQSQDETIGEPHSEKPFDDLDYCDDNEESYQSLHSTDNEDELFNYEVETYSFNKKDPTIQVNSKFPNVVDLRRALNHHALINEFEYFIEKSEPTRFTARCANLECAWKIHACVTKDKVTFKVKNLVETHTCIGSNKGGNKSATQGWIANELLNRNPGSVVDIAFVIDGDKKRFQRFFVSLAACSLGFLAGCRPYISLDACHLKGKFNGVLAVATFVFNRYLNFLMLFEKRLWYTMMREGELWEHGRNLGEYEVCRSSENRAEVKCKGKRWEVILDDTQCTCRVWQVTGLPCVHAAAFIAFIRDANLEKYVDPYYTIEKFKEAYALEIAPVPDKDEWLDIQSAVKIYPPIIKRPSGRPRKNRIIAAGEQTKRRHKCSKCGGSGHHPQTCKNAQSQGSEPYQPSTSKRKRGKKTEARKNSGVMESN
ncbi:transposase, MuDR, MULE transposase domain protein [Artemisia annua]|uniref:Transposase, MuDR, MULE transposase domain protein n=1 Tax=Artemisia annua TaxID=35608 RepID=A0A2U1M453_ARTAN|nr:transposase, MuDR, MULE transposase domain protein [Artemisia annua]